VPLNKALQGHPEAGALWESMIVGILEELGFCSTTHKWNLYWGDINGELLLICCQVDDFAIVTKNPKTADILIGKINESVTTQNKGIGTKYNGVDLLQMHEYIKISCESFIDWVLQMHGWDKVLPVDKGQCNIAPISTKSVDKLQQLKGPMEGCTYHKNLEKEMGFGHWQVLGELIYVYIVCQFDIGYAVYYYLALLLPLPKNITWLSSGPVRMLSSV